MSPSRTKKKVEEPVETPPETPVAKVETRGSVCEVDGNARPASGACPVCGTVR